MDPQTELLFWFVVSVCLTGPIVTWYRLRTVAPGWLTVWGVILVVAVAGRLLESPPLVVVAAVLWTFLVPVPMALLNLGWRLAMQRRFAAARRAHRLAAALHPADGFREVPAAVTAMELAHGGDLDAADAALDRLRHSRSPLASTAFMMLCGLRQRWDHLVAWADAHPAVVARDANIFTSVLRALGETGDVVGLVDLSERERARIDRLPVGFRGTLRLMLFAFGGRPDVVDRILATSFAAVPGDQRRFWWATARWAAGDVDAARREFEELLREADPASAIAIRGRLSRIDTPPAPLDDRRRGVLDAAAARLEQEARFAPRTSVFSASARGTQALIALNVAVFAVQVVLGCVDDGRRIHDAGALCVGCVGRGEWWRLGSATVLHWNAVHLTMNVLALVVLGPAAETALGLRRFLAVYLLSGVGSMAAVAAGAWLEGQPCVCVGASGAVMGIVGATAATMLRGWWRERAAVARGRALAMVGIVVAQGGFDVLVPQMSSTAHLAGAAIGFTVALVLGDRLRR